MCCYLLWMQIPQPFLYIFTTWQPYIGWDQLSPTWTSHFVIKEHEQEARRHLINLLNERTTLKQFAIPCIVENASVGVVSVRRLCWEGRMNRRKKWGFNRLRSFFVCLFVCWRTLWEKAGRRARRSGGGTAGRRISRAFSIVLSSFWAAPAPRATTSFWSLWRSRNTNPTRSLHLLSRKHVRISFLVEYCLAQPIFFHILLHSSVLWLAG